MRVLFYVGTGEWSATSRAILAVARGLAPRGHVVTVACCAGSRLEALAHDAQLDTVVIDGGWFGSGGAWDLRKVLQTRFIEVAVVTSDTDHRIVASAMRFAERGSVLRRVAPFDDVDAVPMGKLSLRMAPAGVVLSSERELRNRRAQGWVIPPVAPIGVDAATYDGIDAIPRGDLGAPPHGLLIACDYDPSGRPRAGAVFRALAYLAPRHAHLHAVIFGPGSADDDLQMHASALGVGRIVSFLGERTDARRVMRGADAGWVLSSGDGGAFACVDFMALRIPVVAERCALTEHFVGDGECGVLLPSGDSAQTASAVAALLTANDTRRAMGNAARLRVQNDFAESAMIDGFERAVIAAGDRTTWPTS